ncbi:hypothetical protein V3C99_000624 [Haemonchus contortus]
MLSGASDLEEVSTRVMAPHNKIFAMTRHVLGRILQPQFKEQRRCLRSMKTASERLVGWQYRWRLSELHTVTAIAPSPYETGTLCLG